MTNDTPLPCDVAEHVAWLKHLAIYQHDHQLADAANMLEQLARENAHIGTVATVYQRRIQQLESGHHEFNRAIDYAIGLSGLEARDFLYAWREGDWEGCREFDYELSDETQ